MTKLYDETEKVSCDMCKKEIPRSVVLSVEGADYTYHFCSPECKDHFFSKNPQLNEGR